MKEKIIKNKSATIFEENQRSSIFKQKNIKDIGSIYISLSKFNLFDNFD